MTDFTYLILSLFYKIDVNITFGLLMFVFDNFFFFSKDIPYYKPTPLYPLLRESIKKETMMKIDPLLLKFL